MSSFSLLNAPGTNVPNQTAPVFCSDEDIYVNATGDFGVLCPASQQKAAGADGVFVSGSPWVLTSASNNFQTQGVVSNQMVWLSGPKIQYPGGGIFMAVDSAAGNSITLRRPYDQLGGGLPPAPAAGLTAVTFSINTLGPQIGNASYDLKNRFSVDDHAIAGSYRSSPWIYDPQVFRDATIYTVLYERYGSEVRTDRGDFKDKVQHYRAKLEDAIGRIQVRWSPQGNDQEPTSLFSTRLAR